MAYSIEQKVLFKHCDPAGIVFYPRYFEMMNDCVELFFADVLQWPFEELLKTAGAPTAEISTRFLAPSRHGDTLQLSLTVTSLGTSSIGVSIDAHCDDQLRFQTRSRLVHVGTDGRSAPWPQPVRDMIETLVST